MSVFGFLRLNYGSNHLCTDWFPKKVFAKDAEDSPFGFEPCFLVSVLLSYVPALLIIIVTLCGLILSRESRRNRAYARLSEHQHALIRFSSRWHLRLLAVQFCICFSVFLVYTTLLVSVIGGFVFLGSGSIGLSVALSWAALTFLSYQSHQYATDRIRNPPFRGYFSWSSSLFISTFLVLFSSIIRLSILIDSVFVSCILVLPPLIVFIFCILTHNFSASFVGIGDTYPSLECSASVLSLCFFSWLSPLINYSTSRPLEQSDLWLLYPSDSYAAVQKAGLSYQQLGFRRPISLFSELFLTLKWHIFLQFCTGTFGSLFAFTGPATVHLLINFLQSNEEKKVYKGFALIFSVFTAAIVRSVLDNNTYFRGRRVGLRIRSLIISRVFSKALSMQSRTIDPASIVNLIQTDAFLVSETASYLHYLLTIPLQIIISLFAIYRLVGYAAFVGVFVLLLFAPINFVIGRKSNAIQSVLMKFYDARVAVAAEVFKSIRTIKFFAWERKVLGWLHSSRKSELDSLKIFYLVMGSMAILWFFIPIMVFFPSLYTFVVWTAGNPSTRVVFTMISLFTTLKTPLFILPVIFMRIIEMKVSIKRIQSFLNREDTVAFTSDHKCLNEVEFSNAYFSWSEESDPLFVLENINAVCPPGKLTVVVGRTGSGKSSFLQAILGEMPLKSGILRRPIEIAYVPQVPWLINGTIRENIQMDSHYDSKRMTRAIAACALDHDLKSISGGELAQIGERGCNLSGGQRARLDLCRAVYSTHQTVLMDDVLSALDAPTAKHVFENAILGEMANRTRVLVTNFVSMALDRADYVILLENGKIKASGTLEELYSIPDLLQDLYIEESIQQGRFSNDDELTPKPVNASLPLAEDKILESSLFEKEEPAELVGEEERCVGRVEWKVYWSWIRAAGGLKFVTAMIMLLACQNIINVSENLLLRELANLSDSNDGSLQTRFLYIYFGLILLSVFLFLVRLWVQYTGALSASEILSKRLEQSLLNAKIRFYDVTPLGRILSRISRDLKTIDRELPSNLVDSVIHGLELLTIALVVSRVVPQLLVICWVPLSIAFYSVGQKYFKASRELKRLDSVSRTPIFTLITESLHGIDSVRSYRLEKFVADVLEKHVDRNHAAYFYLWASNRWLSCRTDILGAFAVAMTGIVLVLVPNGVFDPALAGLTLIYVLGTTDSMMWLIRMCAMAEMDLNSVERVIAWAGDKDIDPTSCLLSSNDAQVQQSGIEQETYLGVLPPCGWPSKGKILVKNLTAKYSLDGQQVLSNLSFQVPAGTKLAICGRTGAGKSSFTRALFRFIPYTFGLIEIDDIDISVLTLQSLRSAISIVPQEPVLFSGTLRGNLDVFNEFTDAELSCVLKRVGLSDRLEITDPVGSNGSNHSVGTRQLISLARALLSQSKILVLDEATSSVDGATDAMIQRLLRKEFSGCTIITIAHRINTILDYDKVIVLERGCLAETGTPQALAQDEKSIFSRMLRDSRNQDSVL